MWNRKQASKRWKRQVLCILLRTLVTLQHVVPLQLWRGVDVPKALHKQKNKNNIAFPRNPQNHHILGLGESKGRKLRNFTFKLWLKYEGISSINCLLCAWIRKQGKTEDIKLTKGRQIVTFCDIIKPYNENIKRFVWL